MMLIPPDRLAEILNVAEDGIVVVNARHEVVLSQRGAAKVFGYDPAEVLSRPLDLLLPERYRPRPAGERVRHGTGDNLLLTAIVRDAEDRKKYEDALVWLNQDLEERVKVRTAELAERNLQLTQKPEENEMFVYSISHDLRSPLVNREGFSEELGTAAQDLRAVFQDERIPPEVRRRVYELVDGDVRVSIEFVRTTGNRAADHAEPTQFLAIVKLPAPPVGPSTMGGQQP